MNVQPIRETERNVRLTLDEAQQVFNYLQGRPWCEVQQLCAILQVAGARAHAERQDGERPDLRNPADD